MFVAKNELFTVPSGYQISRSVRLRSSATAYLQRTNATTGTDPLKFTVSGWMKRGLSSVTYFPLLGSDTNANSFDFIGFSADNIAFRIRNSSAVDLVQIVSSSVYRDFSAWYHLVAVYDSANATSTERVKLYVNGVQITSFASSTYPSLNQGPTGTFLTDMQIGRTNTNSTNQNYGDGYVTEINFVDGQALTPSSFGEYDSITGVWKPKKYTGTYGTNGFYLNFSDNSAATAAAIGKDYSGNGNNWTPNNISLTAGATYDSMLDVPTPFADGSTGRGNYATLNPLDISISQLTLSAGNLIATQPSTGTSRGAGSTFRVLTGKWYFEGTTTVTSGTQGAIAIADNANASTTYGIYKRGGSTVGLSGSPTFATYTSGDVIGVAFDADARTVSFYKNNTLQGTGGYTYTGTDPVGARVTVDSGDSTGAWQLNFGQRPFSYTPPSGFKALNTQNLPTPTIASGNDYFDVNIWSGNASTQIITNSGAMQPDFVWIKKRAGGTVAARDHRLFDAVRGATKYLSSNLTSAEATETDGLTSFNSDGFTLGASDAVNGTTGGTGTYVGWQWNAGGSTVTNTSGSISAQVRANPTAGFSIVTYTGTGANGTIGHGLGAAPKMLIVKSNSTVTSWSVYHSSIGAANELLLNSTAASAASANSWNSTAPTSSVFSVGTASSTNTSPRTYVAYCFSDVAGYSAFGSYTGNGSADGPFVFTGFRPRFVLVKAITAASAENWSILDTSRSPVNVMDDVLWPNVSTAEQTNAINNCDFTSNGFKFRTTDPRWNSGSYTYIYMAFAENPFKYSLAR
jgi:hypothetical protein